MKLFFLRHGPTHAKRAIGWTDLPADLSDTARLQRIDQAIPQNTTCISSDLTRTRETLAAVSGNRPRLPENPALREFHYGDWEDLSFQEISSKDPDRAMAYWRTPGDVSPPNGESWNEGVARMSQAVDAARASAGNTDLLIVCHFGVILSQLARFSSIPARSVLSFSIEPLSLTTIEILSEGSPRVLGVNHLL
ncbi:MAG: histidine phosphatase family protein [Pseudomonadota bacterium]